MPKREAAGTGAPAATGAPAGTAGITGTGGASGAGAPSGAAGAAGSAGTTGTAGAAGTGPGRAIGTPAISASGAHTSLPCEHPPAADGSAAASGLKATTAAPHNPTPTAITLMFKRSKITIDVDSIHSGSDTAPCHLLNDRVNCHQCMPTTRRAAPHRFPMVMILSPTGCLPPPEQARCACEKNFPKGFEKSVRLICPHRSYP